MSRRTVTRFALPGLLAAALAGPAAAQPPMPPPRVPAGCEIETTSRAVAPMPRAAQGCVIEFWLGLNQPPVLNRVPPPPCCAFDLDFCLPARATAVAPMPKAVVAPAAFAEWGATNWTVHPTPSARLAAEPPACDLGRVKLAGTWVRDLDGMVVAATFSGDELKICMTQSADGHSVTVTVTADYAVTREGLVHGVVTGVDADFKRDPKAGESSPFGLDTAELSEGLNSLIDCPFSFRTRSTSAGLMVSNLKVAVTGGVTSKELATLGGMYKFAADGKVPAPKPLKTFTTGMTLPSARYLEHYPQYYTPEAAQSPPCKLVKVEVGADGLERVGVDFENCPATAGRTPLQRWVCEPPAACRPPAPAPTRAGGCGHDKLMAALAADAPATWNPPQPANVPAESFEMLAGAFGQMLGEKQPRPVLPPPPAPPMSSPPVQQAGWSAPPSTLGPPAGVARPLTGTWVREVGPVLYAVKIAPDHLTLTATAAVEVEGGKVVTEGMVVTADYHLTRDGAAAVGLITGVDAILDGPVPEGADLRRMGEELAYLQKMLTDKPFALNVRVYGDALVIGNVRMPEGDGPRGAVYSIAGAWNVSAYAPAVPDGLRGATFPATSVGGRYTWLGDKPLPKPKPVKWPAAAPSPYGPPAPTPGRCVPPVYTAPAPAPGVSEGPPAPGCPSGFIRPTTPVASGPYLPSPAATEAPTPRASDPGVAPPAPVGAPKPGKKAKKKKDAGVLLNVYSSDPNVRMQQLLYQSDDIRQIQNEWRRFWFNEQPSHLTPERVHGGIR